jgi:mycothiol synthase
MNIQLRPYRGLEDLEKMKALVIEGRKASPQSGDPHIGDLDWWLFYGAFVKQTPLEDIITLWEDGDTLIGWVVLHPPDSSDMAVLPSLRGTDYEEQIHLWTEAKLATLLQGTDKAVSAFACADDAARCAMLERHGYVGADWLAYFRQPLDRALPTPVLPEGFSFIEAMRPEWAARRADVHFNAFNPSRMTVEAYAHFMTAPHYDPSLDVVVAAPDGTFAAFAMCWIDATTGVGLFEPVGTRNTMQRRGLGKAALLEGMRRMQARGMTSATVLADADNAGNIAFYEAAGFRKVNTVRKYEKQ